MVKIGLQLRAQLENITKLQTESEDFRWYLKLKCSHCGDETPEFVYLSLLDSQPLKGGRGSASLVIKCKLCSRENSIDIVKDSYKSYDFEDVPNFKTIVTFDCRGVEPTTFDARVGWKAEGHESGTKFTEIDLSNLEWADFDEKTNQPVGIYELEHRFVKI